MKWNQKVDQMVRKNLLQKSFIKVFKNRHSQDPSGHFPASVWIRSIQGHRKIFYTYLNKKFDSKRVVNELSS